MDTPDHAIDLARRLRTALEVIYADRERGTAVPNAKLKTLEDILMDCSTHPAFADADGFRRTT